MVSIVEINDRIGKCQELLDGDPNSQIFAALAEAHRKSGNLDIAFKVCKSGLKIHPNYGSAHIVMAKVHLDRGHFDWAEAEVEKAASCDGRTRPVQVLLSEIHIYKGEFAKAIKILKQLHQIDENNEQIKRLLDIAQKIPEEQTLVINSSKAAGAPEENDESTQHSNSSNSSMSMTTPESEKIKDPKELLQKAVANSGIDGALFINAEGFVVDSEWTLELDESLCGAVMSEIVSKLSPELIENSFGNVNTLLIETTSGIFYHVKDKEGLFLFVGGSNSNLGSIRMKIEKLFNSFHS